MTRTCRPDSVALRLESLEDRSVPSTFTVNTTLDDVTPANGKFSLREAITKANTLAGDDVIVLPAGVYKLTGGDLDINTTITFAGAGASTTIVDGQQSDRVFDIAGTAPSSIKVVFQGLTVRNGNAPNFGAGILVGNADLVVRDCTVTYNRTLGIGAGISDAAFPGTVTVKLVRSLVSRNVSGGNGGGIIVSGKSALTVKDSTIRRNVAGGFGGGIHAATTATLTSSTVSGNIAGSGGGGIDATTAKLTNSTVSGNIAGSTGGGIFATIATLTGCTVNGNSAGSNGGGINATTAATLTNSTVSGNTAGDDGGGIVAITAALTNSTVSGNTGVFGGGILATTATLTNSTVSGNTANNNGGGIFATTANLTNSTVSGNSAVVNTGGGIFATTANLTNSTVSGNSADSGGGIIATTATLTNSTVSGNTAATEGGGIWAITATLLNCTVVENLAHTGGGVFHFPGGTFNVRNTIVALNLIKVGGSGSDVNGAFASQGHNLIGDFIGGTGFTNGVNFDIVGDSSNPIDPKLGPLANNGGKTRTHALLAGSKAIDRGDNAILPPTDQRGFGFPRKKDGNGDGIAIVDIGAFEK